MQIDHDDIKTAGAAMGILSTILLAIVAAARWVFTNDRTVAAKVMLLEQQLATLNGKIDELARDVKRALERGDERMQALDKDINGVRVECARQHGNE